MSSPAAALREPLMQLSPAATRAATDESGWAAPESVAGIVSSARAGVDATKRDVAWRRAQLHGIRRLVTENRAELVAALQADLGRPQLEAVMYELGTIVSEVDECLQGLSSWMAPESLPTPTAYLPASAQLRSEPLGLVCIIAPWNFPYSMVLNPLADALAAGNGAVVKPSEVSPACARALAALLPRYVDASCVAVVQGGVAATTALLRCRFDHIFYTGSGAVARHILAAAAAHLTPCTLELGGKSPVIVAADANLAIAASRIVANKCLNAGQVCLAPDYILAEASIVEPLTAALAAAARRMYGADMAASPDFGRIINGAHHARLSALLAGGGGTVAFAGGAADAAARFMPLTIVREPAPGSALMTDEIFGPLLPVIAVPDVRAAVRFVNARPKPLALYVFTESAATAEAVLSSTSSGGACVNECVLHIAVGPFGGVGASGMGAYHGRYGFHTFSHRKAVLSQPTGPIDAHAMLYAPYSKAQLARLEWLVGTLPAYLPALSLQGTALALALAAVAALAWKVHALGGF